MKKLVLAEKPSVGRELARVLGCTRREKWLESDEYVVTWALGHLITPATPDHYGLEYKRWSLKTLPILPKELDNVVIEKTKDQYELVASLLGRSDVESVIIATDAGREGELVARWILKQANCTKPLQRLWISSQTDSAIKAGFATLKPGSDYENLYAAAECRSAADWYIGYNVSRAMSCKFDTQLSAGRVQTPTLALMVNREDEIESFTGRFYWVLKADFGSFIASRYDKEGTVRIPSEEEAQALKAKIEGKTGTVTSVTEVEKNEVPPQAYDLTELQRDANNTLGFSAKETLDTLQRLYEVHKIVTYPRTDSRCIPADVVPTLKDRLAALSLTPFAARASKIASEPLRLDKRFVDDSQVSDHHAILPTEQRVDLTKLSAREHDLWDLIAMRFLEVLSSDYLYATTTLTADVEGEAFTTRLTVPRSLGWRDVGRDIGKKSAAFSDINDEESTPSIMNLSQGDSLLVSSAAIKRQATLPPDRYTEATLLYAMEHAGRFVEDTAKRKHLANGLGTPATRADIIEKLIQNHCIERKEKELVPTPKGRELVRLVPDQLKSPELTAVWEERLSAISDGTETKDAFISDIKVNAADLVKQVIASTLLYDPTKMGEKLCPHCKWPMIKVEDEFGRVHNVCQRFSCGYEEMEVLKKVEDESVAAVAPELPASEAPVAEAPAVAVVAVAKPVEPKIQSDGAVIKKKVIVKKAAAPAAVKKPEPLAKYETVIEIVKPSHYRPYTPRPWQGNRDDKREMRRDFHSGDEKREPRRDFHSSDDKREPRRDFHTGDDKREVRKDFHSGDDKREMRRDFHSGDEKREPRKDFHSSDDKREPRKDFRSGDRRPDSRSHEDSDWKKYQNKESYTGGTFADFIAASNLRKQKDAEKKNKK